MKQSTKLLMLLALCTLHGIGLADVRPNILLIMVDDLGYGDLSCFGATDLESPHIDRLMSEGMRFNEFYANCCVCSPTRAALLSGCYPERVGVPGVVRTHDSNNWGYLTPDSIMLPERFQAEGYRTILIGKWHLGLHKENRPNQRGFDLFRGFLGDMMDDYWNHQRHGINYMRENEREIDPQGHATDLFTRWTIEELEKQAESKQPFFLYLAYNAPHDPIHPPKDWLERVTTREAGLTEKRTGIVALIEHLDDGIGRVLDALEEYGLSENTIVVFTSDNGGKLKYGASNGKLRADKTHLYEGGIKVPTCIRWPGHVEPGQVTEFHALTMDIVPTLARMCEVSINHEIDGRAFDQLLLQGVQKPFERPVFHMWLQGDSKECVREGDWKLVRDQSDKPFELYNLKQDPCETKDLSMKMPGKKQGMIAILQFHVDETKRVTWKRPSE
jgi:arylsulfatase A-like enzyme